jgi:hypothetical protein
MEVIFAKGHRNILATHPTTLEITKEDEVSRRGDCIIAVSADKTMKDFSEEFKAKLRKDTASLTILVETGGLVEKVKAYGDSHLTLDDPLEMVVRKSNYSSGRTLALKADKAAGDLAKDFVQELRHPGQKVKITLSVNYSI